MIVWIQVEYTTTKWVEVECHHPSEAMENYETEKGERITGMVAFRLNEKEDDK